MSKGDIEAAPKVGTNIDRPVIDLYRPHINSGDCLIVTGYQDFLSSLAILIKEVEELKNPDANDDIRIRISFGIDTWPIVELPSGLVYGPISISALCCSSDQT